MALLLNNYNVKDIMQDIDNPHFYPLYLSLHNPIINDNDFHYHLYTLHDNENHYHCQLFSYYVDTYFSHFIVQ